MRTVRAGMKSPDRSGPLGAEPRLGALARAAPPWTRPQGLCQVVNAWRARQARWRSVVLEEVLEREAGDTLPIPETLAPPIRRALFARGMARLYRHQAEALARTADGQHVVVATPTASGKSLCYHLPVLNALHFSPGSRALYVFPTKALARDQEASLRRLMDDAKLGFGVVTYDGDTPRDARKRAKEDSGVLITNPDMLHTSILPHHPRWARFFSHLRYVVIDELHTYRGVFGSHLSNVLRRLDRVARFHGARPQFVFSSATIGNPKEHAENLLRKEVHLIDRSGAPRGPRRVLVYNPPIVNRELGIRQSALKASVSLASDLVLAGVPTLVFGQSRNQVEVMLKYLRDRLRKESLAPDAVYGYRGGYLPKTRRHIELGLREGRIRCVVATNALELGIDIGSMDAVVCLGYPGTMAGLWQRFGRAGRRDQESLALLVTTSLPVDQYLAHEPTRVTEPSVEHARLDSANLEILIQHLKCAAFELPFVEGEAFGDIDAEAVASALGFLGEHQVVRPVTGRDGKKIYHWSTDVYPANQVSLRTMGWDNFAIIDVAKDKTIAEMDFRSTHTMLHEQAIYQHDGAQYQVERLDFDNHKAFVRLVRPDYYTTAMTHTRVSVLTEDHTGRVDLERGFVLPVGLGDVNVVEKVVGFKKIKFHTHENVGYGEVDLPEMEKPTTAFWTVVPIDLLEVVDAPPSVRVDALWGWMRALHAVAALGLMMDPKDLGYTVVTEPGRGHPAWVSSSPPHVAPTGDLREHAPVSGRFEPTMVLYDMVAGGVGLAQRLYEDRLRLFECAYRLIKRCPCEGGCPSCIGAFLPGALSREDTSHRLLAPLPKDIVLRWGDALGLGLASEPEAGAEGPHA